MPAIGYTHPDQSHFTSRHYWEVGATDTRLRTGWLGRYLDRRRHAGQPAAGRSRSTTRSRRRSRPRRCRSRRSTAPDQYDFWTQPRLGRGRGADARGDRRSSARSRRDPALRTARRRRRAGRPAAQRSCCRSGRRTASPATRARSPIRRRTTPSRSKLAGLAAMLAAGLPLRVVALSAPGEYDTHSDEPAGARGGAPAHRGLAARVPARPRGARPRRPRARARLVGVRPPRAGERLGGHRPRRRRRRLPDRHARERDR